jgi:hypothetical protein
MKKEASPTCCLFFFGFFTVKSLELFTTGKRSWDRPQAKRGTKLSEGLPAKV